MRHLSQRSRLSFGMLLVLVVGSLLLVSPLTSSVPTHAQGGATPTRVKRGISVITPAQAERLVVDFAKGTLGRDVRVTEALGLQANIKLDLTRLMEVLLYDYVDIDEATVDMSVQTITATLRGGFAVMALESSADRLVLWGDVDADAYPGASLIAYVLDADGAAPASAAEALALAKETYPGLAKLSYTVYPVETGQAWYAQSQAESTDIKTGKAVNVPQRVVLAVLPVRNRTWVGVLVARGDLADSIATPSERAKK